MGFPVTTTIPPATASTKSNNGATTTTANTNKKGTPKKVRRSFSLVATQCNSKKERRTFWILQHMATYCMSFGMAGKKVTTTVYITEDQNRLLKELNKRTRVPIAEYIREGIDLVLSQNKNHLPGQLEFNDKISNVNLQPEN